LRLLVQRLDEPAPRSEFLRRWIDQPGAHTRAALRDGSLVGFGVMRPCRSGYKIGPLFADDAAVADDLFCALAGQVPGAPVFLDLPENNRAALKLANLHGMEEVFGCAEMFYGPASSTAMALRATTTRLYTGRLNRMLFVPQKRRVSSWKAKADWLYLLQHPYPPSDSFRLQVVLPGRSPVASGFCVFAPVPPPACQHTACVKPAKNNQGKVSRTSGLDRRGDKCWDEE